jgi:DNA-binding transcriptional ArsR family regulator
MPSSGRQFKDTIYEQLGRVGKTLASPRRLELLDLLCQGPRTVKTLTNEAEQSLANTSQHLQVLRAKRFQAVRMGEGVPDWRARGLPVETSMMEVDS